MWTERLAHLQYILIWVLLIAGILLFLGIIFLASIRAALAVFRDNLRARQALRGRYPLCGTPLRSFACVLHRGHIDRFHRGAWTENGSRLIWQFAQHGTMEQVETREQPVQAKAE